jgi:penicillin G amidase
VAERADDLRLTGLDGPIDVVRDQWGIPHARATTAHDAFVAQGFVQAQDRLGQLEFDRRRAHGRWAEVAGPSAVPLDVFARRCGLGDAARREYDALDPGARAVLDAYADGVNAYLSLGRALPPDLALVDVAPEPWAPWDCCAVFLVRHVVFANWQKKLWRGRLAVELGVETVAHLEHADEREVPLIVPTGAVWHASAPSSNGLDDVLHATALVIDAQGSNAWAFDGTRTASGQPLLAGDPHRLVEVPGVYAQCHLVCPEFDVAGLSFVGVPGFPHFGQTERVAWCVTNANGDYQDLFVERFEMGDPPRYEFEGAWRDAVVRHETITVRDGDPVSIECFATDHGPVVFGDPSTGDAVVLRSTALAAPSSGLSVLLPMLCAQTVDELDAVMRAWVDPVNNLVSADADGSISYRTVGRIPVRSRANAWGPVPGWTGEHEWQGVVAYDELPRLRNPDVGMIITANQRIVDDTYPHYLGLDYARPDRALRLHERLAGLHSATADDMSAVHRDRRSLAADVWVEHLVALDGADAWEREALGALRTWDQVMDAESTAAAVYVVTRDAAGRIVAHDPRLARLRAPLPSEPPGTFQPLELRLWALLTALLARDDTTLLPRGTTWDALLAAALADGVGMLRARLGDDPGAWRWGSLHVLMPSHPLSALHPESGGRLDPPGVAVGGEWDTVFSTAHPAGFGYHVTTASVARYVFDLGDRRSSRWVVPHGASGDATNTHFADQQSSWAAGELLPILTDWDELTAGDAQVTRLSPAGR